MKGKFHNHNKGLLQQKDRLTIARLNEFITS